MYDDVTLVFKALGHVPLAQDMQKLMPVLEWFVVFKYDRGSTCMSVNEEPKDLFTYKGRSIELIHPTADALFSIQKVLFTKLDIAGGKHEKPAPAMPSAADWGLCHAKNTT